MMNNNILVIDDEPDIRQLLSITISRMGFSTHCAENISQAKQALTEENFQLCLTDLRLPDGSGLEIVKLIQDSYSHIPVIVITAHGSINTAITAMKEGAFDFLNKPVDLEGLRSLIRNAISAGNTAKDDLIHEIIGNSASTAKLKEQVLKVSRSQAPVMIYGESGSGKELVAKCIHNHSSRKDQPFIAINCGAIPRDLMESEFFGHIKGSFTGAHQDKQGLFHAANGGTLFLDEVAELPQDMQVKLLRAIQEKSIRPVGAHSEINIDVRILSATHQNLQQAISENRFRNDLYYRINVIEVMVPPLRDRREDIPELASFIFEKITASNNSKYQPLSSDAIKKLQRYHFPGNVRELENILERAAALSEDSNIHADDLQFPELQNIDSAPQEIPQTTPQTVADATPASPIEESIEDDSIAIDYDASKESIDSYLTRIEKDILLNALEQHRWNRTATAKYLNITFRSLRYRLKKLEIDIDSEE